MGEFKPQPRSPNEERINWQQLYDEVISTKLGCRLTKSGAQTLTTGVTTSISWSAEDFDFGNFWLSSVASDVVIRRAGVYVATLNAIYAANSAGERRISITKGASNLIQSETSTPGHATIQVRMSVSATFKAEIGDVVRGRTIQDSGGNLDIIDSTNNNFSVVLLYASPTGG